MSEDDVSLCLMAIANVLGIWNREMRIPEPNRVLLVKQELGQWKLNRKGHPVPSKELLEEIAKLESAK